MNHNGFLAWYSLTSIWMSGAALCSTNRAIPNTRYSVIEEIELDQWQVISSIMWRLTILSQNQSKYSDTNGARHYIIIISSGQGTNLSRGSRIYGNWGVMWLLMELYRVIPKQPILGKKTKTISQQLMNDEAMVIIHIICMIMSS